MSIDGGKRFTPKSYAIILGWIKGRVWVEEEQPKPENSELFENIKR